MRKYEKPKLRLEEWEEDEDVFTDGVHASVQPDGSEDFDGEDAEDGWW